MKTLRTPKKGFNYALAMAVSLLTVQANALAAEIVIYGFEQDVEGWSIPDWALSDTDYVASPPSVSSEFAAEGKQALEVQASFPGKRWTGAYVEREPEVSDWTPFGSLSIDVYLPPYAPTGLGAKIILTVGPDWTWTEMNRVIELTPGEWTTLSANIKPKSMDWKFFPDDAFRSEVHRFGVRIETNGLASYTGPCFVDNIRLAE